MEKPIIDIPVLEEISEKELDELLSEALERAKKGEGREVSVVFTDIRKKILN